MFAFQEELKNFKPSTDADLVALDLKGDEAADLQTLLRYMVQDERKNSSRQFDQLGLEDVR